MQRESALCFSEGGVSNSGQIRRRLNSLERQPRPNSLLYSALIDQRCSCHIVKSESEIAGNRALLWFLASRFAARNQLTKVGVNRGDVLEVSEVAVVTELGDVVRAELVGLL